MGIIHSYVGGIGFSGDDTLEGGKAGQNILRSVIFRRWRRQIRTEKKCLSVSSICLAERKFILFAGFASFRAGINLKPSHFVNWEGYRVHSLRYNLNMTAFMKSEEIPQTEISAISGIHLLRFRSQCRSKPFVVCDVTVHSAAANL